MGQLKGLLFFKKLYRHLELIQQIGKAIKSPRKDPHHVCIMMGYKFIIHEPLNTMLGLC